MSGPLRGNLCSGVCMGVLLAATLLALPKLLAPTATVIHTGQARTSRSSQMKPDQSTASRIQSEQARTCQIKPDQTRSSEGCVKLTSSRLVAPLAWHPIYLFVLCVCACISMHFGSQAITLGAVGFQVGPRITFGELSGFTLGAGGLQMDPKIITKLGKSLARDFPNLVIILGSI